MFKIYTSKPDCPMCIKSRELLAELDIPFQYITTSIEDIKAMVPGATTVPQIFFYDDENFVLIGGFDELEVFLLYRPEEVHHTESDCPGGFCSLEPTTTGRFSGTSDNKSNNPRSDSATHTFKEVYGKGGEPSNVLIEYKADSFIVRGDIRPAKVRTIFNPNNTGYETGIEPLFNGDQCGFTNSITQQYPIVDEIYQKMISQLWNETEVDLTQDRQDMLTAPAGTIDFSVQNIMYQSLVDSAASRAITGVLMEHVSNTDLEAAYNCIGLFETIHARTYLHIIKQTMADPIQALRDGYANKAILARAIPIVKHFDALANMSRSANKVERDDKVLMAVFALYMLESVCFPQSFTCTFAVAETGIMQGISQDVSLILRDESLHALLGQAIFNIEKKRDPAMILRLKPLMQECFDEVMEAEKVWIRYLFTKERQVLGLNETLSLRSLDYLATPVSTTLDLQHNEIFKQPLGYMKDYIDSARIQIANQELQNGTYLLNAILAPMNMDETLRKLKEKYEAM